MRSACVALSLVLCLSFTSAGADVAGCGPVPTLMRAVVATKAGGPDVLQIQSVPTPRADRGEVLVRVHYASINPVDWKLQERGRLPYPAVPGGDFSGTVVAIAPDVTGIKCGAAVVGIADAMSKGGSYAEYVAVQARDVVPKPAEFGFAEGAAYPTVAIAAWRYLVVAAKVTSGERVLVHGAAGGVGSMVVQMAKATGAHVTATASARNHEYLRQLGADVVIDYTTTRFEDVVKDMDIVVDTVGGDTLARSPAVLRDGGRLVSLAGTPPAAACSANRIKCPATPPWDVAGGLAYAAPLIADGKLRVSIERTYPMDEAAAAQQHSRSGRTRGKLVLAMDADQTAAVLAPLQAYLDGHATGLEQHFRRAFASDATLVGYKDGAYRRWSAADYIVASSSGRAPPDEAQRRRAIRSIAITGEVATAVIELDYPDMKALDHMSLLRFGDEWRIIVKAYDAMTPAAAL